MIVAGIRTGVEFSKLSDPDYKILEQERSRSQKK